MRAFLVLAFSSWVPLAGLGCAPANAAAPATPAAARTLAATTPGAAGATPDPAQDTRGAPGAPLAWAPFDKATFARAKAEHKLVILDGAAEWCHWCHVMEAVTYHDEAVQKLVAAHFIAAKVDVDARPDIEERYGAWGWPATVLFSADGAELGKYRGFIAPDAFADILREATSGGESGDGKTATPEAPAHVLGEEELAWIARMTELELADFYDADAGGWGRWQKAAVASDNAWTLARARAGDADARERVLFTLGAQRKLLDPVWGGIYQYSAAKDWEHPHFEKLMTFQAGALENYAEAFALTKDPQWLTVARSMRAYIDGFLTSPEGGFYATQDADLNAHEAGKRFLTGHEYYVLDDAHRRALGVPHVDAHEYGKENGLAIAAYVTYAEAVGDPTALAVAERAARRVLATHATPRGGIAHDAGEKPSALLHLADNAAFGFALVRLDEARGDATYRDAAAKIADVVLSDLEDKEHGGFYAASVDPDAVGVFAVRRKPFEENVVAVRFLARLAKKAPREADKARYRAAIGHALAAVLTPDAIKDRGRVLGDVLLALEETRGVR